MADALARATDWMSDVLEWLRNPITAMPTLLILQRLPTVFEVNVCSWNWREDRTTFGMIMNPPDILLQEFQTLEVWQSGDFFDCHALITWFERTRNTGTRGDHPDRGRAQHPHGRAGTQVLAAHRRETPGTQLSQARRA